MPIYSQATEVSLQGVFLLQPEYVLEGLVPDTGTLVDFIKKEEKYLINISLVVMKKIKNRILCNIREDISNGEMELLKDFHHNNIKNFKNLDNI